MPRVEEVLDSLSEAEYISKIDLNKGYYQIPIKEDDKPKTAFCSSWGKLMFTRMPFGLRNAPSVFQHLMDQLLHDHKLCAQVYIDDVAVYSKTWPYRQGVDDAEGGWTDSKQGQVCVWE